MKRLIAVLLALVMVFAAVATLAACDNNKNDGKEETTVGGGNETTGNGEETTVQGGDDTEEKIEFIAPARPSDAVLPAAKVGDYTYNSYAISLGSNWNPHAWETNGDQSILSYLTSPFVTMEALDTEEGLYQWVGEMATAIKDVTAQKQDLLTKYNVTLPEGKTAEEVKSGYVFEFTLNPDAKWEDGTVINADSYIYSMQQLLNPKMKNYRANLYIAGESAIAGGLGYYYNNEYAKVDTAGQYAIADMTKGENGAYTITENGDPVYIALDAGLAWLGGNSLAAYVNAYGEAYFDVEAFGALRALADEEGFVALTDDSLALIKKVISVPAWGEDPEADYVNYLYSIHFYPETTFDTVGLVKTGEYSFIYVCDTAIDFNYFLTSCTDTWLVHKELYEKGMKEVGGLIVTDYMTSLETSISYGTYKMTAFEDGKQVVYEQNEKWYGFEKTEDGKLVSYTQFTVDGKYLQQYITTKIVIDVMTEDVAKQKFLKGELMSYSPTAAELNEYKLSKRLQVVDETYTMSFFFNTGLENLKALDASGKNAFSVVLNNYNFRKAMSFAIDRADFVTATQAWTPAYSLMNHLYHYDIYNDPSSSYRKSKEAMQAIVNLYGVEYGEGKLYETLEEAYDSITGYNLTEAKALMTKACEELVAAGLYTKGEAIKIQIGWAKGALTEDDTKQCELIQKYLNAAVEGSGFGTITLEPLGNITDRYGDTAAGLYAIGYGAWGGAAFYPFRNFQVYTDPSQYDINEAGCWDPTTETLTLTVEGEEVTMTWQDWGNSMIGTGVYANADNKVKLAITAQMEEAFLAKFYRIPLAVTTVCTLSSYKVEDYTEDYNIMYGFGGFRIMDYNYNDAEWAAYVESQGGELNYK